MGTVNKLSKLEGNPLFDAHCHLQLPPLRCIASHVLQRANEHGVVAVAAAATREEDWMDVEQLANAHKNVVPSFGIHPWYANTVENNWLSRLEAILSRCAKAGVGEAGLCLSKRGRLVDPVTQLEICNLQLRLALKMGRVISLHCVKQHGALLELIKKVTEEKMPSKPWFLLHAYSGSAEQVRQYVQLGAMFSIGGAVTDLRHKKLQAAVAAIPLDRLMLETDSPDQCPASHLLPKLPPLSSLAPYPSVCTVPNEPAYLPVIAEAVATVRGEAVNDIIYAATVNAIRFFEWKD